MPNGDTEIEKPKLDYSKSKTKQLPTPKPIDKDRINEFASLLSSSVHLSRPQPQPVKKQIKSTATTAITVTKPIPKTISSPSRFEDQSFSSVQSADSDREERESYHTDKLVDSEQEQIKRHIDASYNEKLDDRGSIKVKTASIRALFEQKISDTNRALSQSSEHILHLSEVKQQHKKVPISYGSLQRNFPNHQQIASNNIRRRSYQDNPTMNKYTDHIVGAKDVVIEDKQVKFRLNLCKISLRTD